MHPMLNIAVRAARNAGQVIVKAFSQPENIEAMQKGSNDFVTNVDREAEAAIIYTIKKSYPEHSIIGEESGEVAGSNADYQWIIDPLDGTTNFIKGIPHFCVSIALRVKGRTEQAVVYDPIRDELFTATRGSGAQLNGYRIRTGKAKDLAGTVLATGFPSKQKHQIEPYLKMFQALFIECSDIRRAGSAALDLAYVAAGRVDGFWEMGLKPWDTAAGELLAREAGAIVTDFVGGHNYENSGNIVAGNPRVVKEMLGKLREHLPDTLAR
ncbi:myo-inositol-1(or 4)-monophosphatase [Aeromonas sp. RU39B]|uniref:inositol-1-monophosphatase n=1 Tax=Aeromonas sp. RU39B TaxID=1907416 RepID=UPI000955D765|nr:inositol-1-monophosphatase [Aeromonas sp. RU39B]SIQ13531.1 myo-inositol-1(or 4)-monophosphatase [Aeromonas sp. RU39B]